MKTLLKWGSGEPIQIQDCVCGRPLMDHKDWSAVITTHTYWECEDQWRKESEATGL